MLSDLLIRLRALFRRKAVENELDDELRFHFEQQVEKFAQSGMPLAEAHRRARLLFGGSDQIKEECREAHGVHFFETLAQDVRYALRVLRKSPGFTTAAVLILALGIGANTAIFSLIDAVMLRDLPIRDPQQLVIMKWSALAGPYTHDSYFWGNCPEVSTDRQRHFPEGCTFSYPMYEQIRAERNIFSDVSATTGVDRLHVTANGFVSMDNSQFVSGDFFTTLGVQAIVGRTLDPLDDTTSAQPVAMLRYDYWRSRFAGDSAIIGNSILIENAPYTVVGVAAPEFSGLDPGLPADLWVPFSAQPLLAPRLPKRTVNSFWVEIIARRKPGVSFSQANAALNVMFAATATTGPDAPFKPADLPAIELVNASHGLVSLRNEFSQMFFVLMTSVGLVLLIACANLGSLSLARGTARQREVWLRFALGASHERIVRQLLTENLLIAGAGASLGILFAYPAARVLVNFLSTGRRLPIELDVHPDAMILSFTATAGVLSAVLFGLIPALRGMRANEFPVLREAGKSSTVFGRRRFKLGESMVVAQVALSVVVLAAAGLLVHTLVNLKSLDVGFNTRNLLLFGIDMSLTHYEDHQPMSVYQEEQKRLALFPRFTKPGYWSIPHKGNHVASVYQEVQDRLAGLPGVLSASYSEVSLLSGANMDSQFSLPDAPGKMLPSDVLPIGRDFFKTLDIPLLTGRTFTLADFAEEQPEPAIVNKAFADELFGSENPLGRQFVEPGIRAPRVIIGVVADAKYASIRREVRPTVYLPLKQADGVEFELRTVGDPKALLPAVRSVVSGINSNILISRLKTQVEQIDQTLYQERLVASLSALFGALALLLACIGLYGLLSHEVAQRTRQIGIRMALGAQQREVFRLVVRRGFLLAVIGSGIGIVTAVGVTRYLQSLLYGIQPTDPYTFVGVAVLLALVALFACSLPARRATRVDPMVALRCE